MGKRYKYLRKYGLIEFLREFVRAETRRVKELFTPPDDDAITIEEINKRRADVLAKLAHRQANLR